MEDASGSTAVAAASPPAASAASPPRPLQLQHSLDLSSRADSANSSLSQGSGSGGSEPPGGGGGGVQRAGSARASIDLERAPSTSSDGGLGPVKVDARSAALKALAGASAIVSKSRCVPSVGGSARSAPCGGRCLPRCSCCCQPQPGAGARGS